MKELGKANNKIGWKHNTRNAAANIAGIAKDMLDNLVGGGSQGRRRAITINAKAETAFVAVKGMDMAYALCDE